MRNYAWNLVQSDVGLVAHLLLIRPSASGPGMWIYRMACLMLQKLRILGLKHNNLP